MALGCVVVIESDDPKFRRLRLAAPKLQFLFDANAAIDLLMMLGWEIVNDQGPNGQEEFLLFAGRIDAVDFARHQLRQLKP